MRSHEIDELLQAVDQLQAERHVWMFSHETSARSKQRRIDDGWLWWNEYDQRWCVLDQTAKEQLCARFHLYVE